MLGKEEIAELARVRGLRSWQEEKRYVQALALYSLRNSTLICNGGTYLWFFHGLDRFSDDLDFTVEGSSEDNLPDLVVSTTRLFGLSCQQKVVKDDRHTLSFRIDARGPLYASESDICRVYVEVSRRENLRRKPLPVKLDEPLYGLPMVFLRGMDLVEVAAEKMRAVLRRRSARDSYDLWYLLKRRAVRLDRGLLQDKLSFYGTKFEKVNLEKALEAVESSWSKELKPIILGAVPPYDEVKEEIIRALA